MLHPYEANKLQGGRLGWGGVFVVVERSGGLGVDQALVLVYSVSAQHVCLSEGVSSPVFGPLPSPRCGRVSPTYGIPESHLLLLYSCTNTGFILSEVSIVFFFFSILALSAAEVTRAVLLTLYFRPSHPSCLDGYLYIYTYCHDYCFHLPTATSTAVCCMLYLRLLLLQHLP